MVDALTTRSTRRSSVGGKSCASLSHHYSARGGPRSDEIGSPTACCLRGLIYSMFLFPVHFLLFFCFAFLFFVVLLLLLFVRCCCCCFLFFFFFVCLFVCLLLFCFVCFLFFLLLLLFLGFFLGGGLSVGFCFHCLSSFTGPFSPVFHYPSNRTNTRSGNVTSCTVLLLP